jgi:hypothetical protein
MQMVAAGVTTLIMVTTRIVSQVSTQPFHDVQIVCLPFDMQTYSPTWLGPDTLGKTPSLTIVNQSSWAFLKKRILAKATSEKFASGWIRVVLIVNDVDAIYIDCNGIVKAGDNYYKIDKTEFWNTLLGLGYKPPIGY